MAGWIKMELGMEVGLSPDDFVLAGDPAPSQNGGFVHLFLLLLLSVYVKYKVSIFNIFRASTESAWLKWWTRVDLQMTPATNGPPRVKSKWSRGFTVAADDQQTLTAGTTTGWSTYFTDIAAGQLTR